MRPKQYLVYVCCLCAMMSLGAGSVRAAASDTPTAPSPLKIANDLVKKQKYEDALVALKKSLAADPENADLLNLTGFSYRKLRDLDNAYKYYSEALTVNPEHTGALNYLGILYVNTGQPEKALELLTRLDDACFFTCDEYTQLKQAIESGSAPEW